MVKKGQAALEFLMTYGWAFIAMTVIIGALYLFIDVNPKDRLPDTCSFGDSFYCKDFKISSAGILTMSLKNTVGVPLNVATTTCVIDGNRLQYDTPVAVAPAGDFQLTCDLNKQIVDKTKVSVTIVFYKQGMSFPSSTDGVVFGSATAGG